MPLKQLNGSIIGNSNTQQSSSGSGVPAGSPILQSALQSRFVVRVDGAPQEFAAQTIAFAMNLAKQELCMLVEQSVTAQTREHVIIQDMINNPDRLITFEIHDFNGNVIDTLKFEDCVVEDHQIDFSYALSGVATHVVLLSYANLDLGNGKAQAAYASAMSVIGKP